MCGICGVWGPDGDRAVSAMVAAMRHRGPDDSGTYHDASIALGMTRLAIIDVSPAGHQPMCNAEGTVWIVYNGEVYNFQDERRALEAKGYSFASSSDTEVVLRLYEEYGDDFLSRLRGMFALAIYDRRGGRERLLLARDQFGIKPLLIARAGHRLVFASELKALLTSDLLRRDIDPVALRQLLTFGSVYQPRTILRGVSMMPPAHRLIVEAGQERLERYWSLGIDRHPYLRRAPYEEQVSEVTRVLEESVRLQLVSDVPLGAFLSGGVDSSLLVAMMMRNVAQRVKTFSVGFETEGAAIDESGDAARMAAFLGTDHTTVQVSGKHVRDRIVHIAASLDQPSVDGVNSYFVSLAAHQGVTVAVSGTGGDELFAGYPWFRTMVVDQRRIAARPWNARAKGCLAAVARQPVFDLLLLGRSAALVRMARQCAGFRSRYASCYQIFGAPDTARLLAADLRQQAQAGRAAHFDLDAFDELPEGSAIERVSGLCLRGYTTNQLLRDIDAVSMAHSLEVRVPYLDPVVADVALSLPDSTKLGSPIHPDLSGQGTYQDLGTKRVLLDVARAWLPPDFGDKPKRGFAMPFDRWLRGPLRDVLTDTLSEGTVRTRGLLDVQEATALRDGFLAGHLGWAQPWLLMILELWCREVLDQVPVAQAPLVDVAKV